MYQVVFQTQGSDAGKIVISITTAYDAGTNYFVRLVGPAGLVRDYPVSPDATGQSVVIKLDIPTDISDNYLPGAYTFSIRIERPTLDPITVTESYTFSCLKNLAFDLDVFADCYSKTLVLRDLTVYPDDYDVVRTIVLDTPVVENETDVPDATYTGETNVVSLVRDSGIAYENVTYTARGSSIATKTTEDGDWTFIEEYKYAEKSVTYKVVCNLDACGVIKCADEYIRNLLDEARCKGGISKLTPTQQSKLSLIQLHLAMYNYFVKCQDSEGINYYYAALKNIVGECDCQEEEGPKAIADSGIVYIAGKSAYEQWLEDNEGTFEDFLNALNPVGEWVVIDDAFIDSSFEQGDDPLRYRIERTGIRFAGKLNAPILGVLTETERVLTSEFNPGVNVAMDARIPVVNNGVHVGSFRRASNGWFMDMNTDYTFLGDYWISGLLPSTANLPVVANTDWILFQNADFLPALSGGHYVQSDAFSWKLIGNKVGFKGAFDGDALSSSGYQVIVTNYFTDRDIVLESGCSAPVFETASNASQGKCVGRIFVQNNTLYFAADSSLLQSGVNKFHVAGEIRIA